MYVLPLRHLRPALLATALALAIGLSACGGGSSNKNQTGSASPKNIIVMISDGASANTWEMGAYWQAGVSANQLEAYRNLSVRMGMTTYPLNTSKTPTNNDNSTVNYDAVQAWDSTIGTAQPDNYATAIEGYKYLKKAYTDSAAAGTALASGIKTFNSAINYDNYGKPVEYITHIAKAQGKATGVVTTVNFSHATPTTFSAQYLSRYNMTALAASMLRNGNVDLIMGTGNPDYDSNGVSILGLSSTDCAAKTECKNPYDTIAEPEWKELQLGTLTAKGTDTPWTLIQSKSAFEQLASGKLSISGPLIGLPQVRSTLQQARDEKVLDTDSQQPSGVKAITTVPDLATMSTGALNHLGRNNKGFFLMIEGGAVDWAAHANQTGRMIEEQVDFNRALAAVEAWVEKNSSWNETLLIVTTDHGNALPLNTDSDTKAFSPVINKGVAVVPDVRFWSDNHTNELVRLWSRGPGSERFASYVRGKDAKFAQIVAHNTDGSYIDNTDVFKLMKSCLTP